MSDKVALQDLSAEQEADRLLEEDDHAARQQQHHTADAGKHAQGNDALHQGLEQLEEEENLPPPATQNQTSAVRPDFPGGPSSPDSTSLTFALSSQTKRVHPAPIIAIWIALSSSVILFNAKILFVQPPRLSRRARLTLSRFPTQRRQGGRRADLPALPKTLGADFERSPAAQLPLSHLPHSQSRQSRYRSKSKALTSKTPPSTVYAPRLWHDRDSPHAAIYPPRRRGRQHRHDLGPVVQEREPFSGHRRS